jgi:hypothetical protein
MYEYKIRNVEQPVITLCYSLKSIGTTCEYTRPSGVRSLNYQLLKMATPLQSCTKQEMRSMIQFLNVKPLEICVRMLAKYGTSCVNKTHVYEQVQKFKNGVQIVEDSLQPGQAHCVIMPKMDLAVDDLIQENCYN